MEKERTEKFLNVPNCLSLLRLALVPVYWALYMGGLVYWAVVVFVVASLTDLIDGKIARKYNLITKWGKVLDPFADKLMQVSAMLTLTITGDIHWVITMVAFAKELYMIIGGALLFNKHVVVYSNIYGKLATVLISGGISLALLAKAFQALGLAFYGVVLSVATVILWIGMAVSLAAAVIYTHSVIKSLKGKNLDDKSENEKIELNI